MLSTSDGEMEYELENHDKIYEKLTQFINNDPDLINEDVTTVQSIIEELKYRKNSTNNKMKKRKINQTSNNNSNQSTPHSTKSNNSLNSNQNSTTNTPKSSIPKTYAQAASSISAKLNKHEIPPLIILKFKEKNQKLITKKLVLIQTELILLNPLKTTIYSYFVKIMKHTAKS